MVLWYRQSELVKILAEIDELKALPQYLGNEHIWYYNDLSQAILSMLLRTKAQIN